MVKPSHRRCETPPLRAKLGHYLSAKQIANIDKESEDTIRQVLGYARWIEQSFFMQKDVALREINAAVRDASSKFERYVGGVFPEESVHPSRPFTETRQLANLCGAMVVTKQDAVRLAWSLRTTLVPAEAWIAAIMKSADEINAYPPTPVEESGLLLTSAVPLGIFVAGAAIGAAAKRLF